MEAQQAEIEVKFSDLFEEIDSDNYVVVVPQLLNICQSIDLADFAMILKNMPKSISGNGYCQIICTALDKFSGCLRPNQILQILSKMPKAILGTEYTQVVAQLVSKLFSELKPKEIQKISQRMPNDINEEDCELVLISLGLENFANKSRPTKAAVEKNMQDFWSRLEDSVPNSEDIQEELESFTERSTEKETPRSNRSGSF